MNFISRLGLRCGRRWCRGWCRHELGLGFLESASVLGFFFLLEGCEVWKTKPSIRKHFCSFAQEKSFGSALAFGISPGLAGATVFGGGGNGRDPPLGGGDISAPSGLAFTGGTFAASFAAGCSSATGALGGASLGSSFTGTLDNFGEGWMKSQHPNKKQFLPQLHLAFPLFQLLPWNP